MNIYSCWYHGNFGYGCRTRQKRWMFIPELGQPDGNIYKNLYLDDLMFKNPFDKKIELELERRIYKFTMAKIFFRFFFPRQKPLTVGGLLFTVHS